MKGRKVTNKILYPTYSLMDKDVEESKGQGIWDFVGEMTRVRETKGRK